MAKAAMDEGSISPALKRGDRRCLQSGGTLVPKLEFLEMLISNMAV